MTKPRTSSIIEDTGAIVRSQEASPTSSILRQTRELWLLLLGGFCAAFAGSLLALTFVHDRGVNLSGDEPGYITEAFSLGRLHTWNQTPAFASSVLNHLLGSRLTLDEFFLNHGVKFPSHPIGFSAILAPSLAFVQSLGLVHLELLTLMSGLVVWLGVEVTNLTRAPRSWLLIPVALFLAPGYLLATTQVYPDLLSGLVLAVVIVRVMVVERFGTTTIWTSVVTGSLIFIFIVMDNKNIVVGVLVATVATLITRRRATTNGEVASLVSIVAVGVVGIVAFNWYAYGHPLGPIQTLTPFTGESFTRFVALFFDRRHGMLVQSPATLLGFVGAARWWRRTPWSVTVGVAAAFVVLVGNASLAGGMAGGSFVGRYEWEALPLALSFAGLFLIEVVALRRRAATKVMGILLLLALLESWALVTSRSDALSFIANGWDPASYLGWWGRFDPSPILNYFNGEWSNARNLWGLATLVALAVAASFALNRLLGVGFRYGRTAIAALLAAFVFWGVTLMSPFLLPAPILYRGSDLGPFPLPVPSHAITVSGAQHKTKILSGPNLSVLPGTYRVVIAYDLIDASQHTAILEARETNGIGQVSVHSNVFLPSTNVITRQTIELKVVGPGSLSILLTWRGSGRLTVDTVSIAKTASCHVVNCQGGWL